MEKASNLRFDRAAFKRGFEDVMTLRPLRDALTGNSDKKNGGSSTASARKLHGNESGSYVKNEAASKG
jgi:hypothetical protein